MSAAKYFSNLPPVVKVVPTKSTVQPEPEPPLNAEQFYAINGHVFRNFRIGDDMMLSRKETVVVQVGQKYLNVHREVLVGCKALNAAFSLNMRESQTKKYAVEYELDGETNSEFEFQAHLVLVLALYGVTQLPAGHYSFERAGVVMVRALALAEYRIAEDYVNARLNTMVTKYFNRLVDWKREVPFLSENSLQVELHRSYLMELNDTYLAYKHSNIRVRQFPERAFGNLIALHCPARAWEMFQSEVDEGLARRVGTAAMYIFGRLNISGEVFERSIFSNEDLSLFRFPQ